MRSCGAISRGFGVFSAVATLVGCPHAESPPPRSESVVVVAQPASGDFSWSIDDARHPLRAGAAYVGIGGALEIVLADTDVKTPCDARGLADEPSRGVDRVRVRVPRGLDVDWPIGRPISPDVLQLQPLDRAKDGGGGKIVARYELELEAIDARPGGRVVGRLAWVGAPKDAALGVEVTTFGEGRFDVPMCASQSELDALAMKTARTIDPPPTPVQGTTTTGTFTAARAFATLRTAYQLSPHVAQIELYTDPLVDCATRREAKGTTLRVSIDAGTGLGRYNGTREPIGVVECGAGSATWSCMGDASTTRGFIEVSSLDLRVGGHMRATLAIEGPTGAFVQGTLEAQLCAPD